MNDYISRFGPILGRILIGAVYLANGIGLTISFHQVAAMMTDRGIPASTLLLALVILVWIAGSVCVILGWQFRLAASALFLLTLPVLIGIHGPWNADAASFQNELNHFLKGVAMLGGLAYLAAFGPGKFSLGYKRGLSQFGDMGAGS